MIIQILLIILGFVLLIKGADFLVEGSSNIAKKLRIPEIIIGLTIVSIGTSMPELFVSLTSSLNNSSDMAIGNIIGSNISNLLLILGISAMIHPIEFQDETIKIENPMGLFITILFFILCNTNCIVSKNESIILIILFVAFILYTIIMSKPDIDENENIKNEKALIVKEEISIIKSIFYIILGIIGLKFGGDFTVDNATIIANKFNISEKIIGLTILAIGTSLPELVTSVTAALKGNSDIAIGNIIGSNLFNILLIIGVSSFITPLQYNLTYNIQMGFLIVAMLLLMIFPFIKPKKLMSRINGLIYFILYITYMTLLFII